MTADDIVMKYFKSNQGIKGRLDSPLYAKRINEKMKSAQIELINMHLNTMNNTDRCRAELVKAGLYRGQIVNS